MAPKSIRGSSYRHDSLRLVVFFLGICLVGYIVRNMKENLADPVSCPVCECKCSLEDFLSIPLDCGKHDADMNKEMEKDVVELLSDELNLQRDVTNDMMEHSKVLILEAKESSSHYQKEAEKCNLGVEACEEAREKAEAALRAELKQSELWEKRARELGWKDRKGAHF